MPTIGGGHQRERLVNCSGVSSVSFTLDARIAPPMSVASPAKLSARLLADLIAVMGSENVLHHHDELVVYECDGYVIEKNVPDVVVFPTSTRAGRRGGQALQSPRRPVRPARGRDEPGRGHAGHRRRGDDLPDPDEADPGDQHPRPLRDRRAGGGQRLADPGAGRDRIPLRPRPVEPGGLHDRRQRRRPTRAARTRSSTA